MNKFYPVFPGEIRTIGVPAPASLPDKKRFEGALSLAERWGLKVKKGNFFHSTSSPEKYFSASAEERLHELNAMIRDEEIDMILCARGGYGSAYLLPDLDRSAWKNRKKPLLFGGYSDISALHLAMAETGIPGGIACPMFSALAEISQDRFAALSMKNAISSCLRMMEFLTLQEENKYKRIAEDPCIIGGLAWKRMWKMRSFHKENKNFPLVCGRLLPVNLTLLTRLTGTEYLPDFKDCILLLEEVGELPRKVDFSFLQLHLAGILKKCAGIVLGQYTECGKTKELYTIFSRVAEMTELPVYGFVPFGHGKSSSSLICGEPCMIREDGGFYLLRKST